MKMNKFVLIFSLMSLLLACKPFSKLSDAKLSISGTTWQYTDSDWTYTITFSKSGKLVTTHPNDKTPNNDFWSQKGEIINFQFNDGTSKYTGKMESSKLIKGKAKSNTGQWDWTLKRIK
jgi:hypothetical protein